MKKLCYRCLLETVTNGYCTSCGAQEVSRPDSASDLLPLGARLDEGSIIVGDSLGRGGFGATYIARDLKNNCLIALKEFAPQHMMRPERKGLSIQIIPDKQQVYEHTLASFRRESKLLSKLRHPNIVSVFFDMEENNTAYYGMELLQGRDLRHWVSGRLPLNPKEACDLLFPIMDALDYLHKEKHTLHRDISPDNVFIRTGSQYPNGYSPCLIDFGAAYSAMKDFTQSAPSVKKNGFSPLEQNWDRSQQGSFTDVYAFAATLYYLVTGQVPPPSTDRSLVGDILKAPGSLNPQIPPQFDQVLLKALALRPADRIQDMQSLCAALYAALKASPPQRPQRPASSQRAEAYPPQSAPPPMPRQWPVPPPPPPPLPPQRSEASRSGLGLLSLLIDGVVFYGVALAATASVSPALGCVLGLMLMMGINTILSTVSGHGTLGQRVFRLRLKDVPSAADLFLYNVMRALVPLSLIDELIALAKNKDQSVMEKCTHVKMLWRSTGHGENSVVPSPSEPPDVPVQVRTASLYCKAGLLKGRMIPLGRMHILGRGSEQATFSFPEKDTAISHRHCMIFYQDGGWYAKDMNSRNGTIVNGQRLPAGGAPARLSNGDIIQIGEEILVFTLS